MYIPAWRMINYEVAVFSKRVGGTQPDILLLLSSEVVSLMSEFKIGFSRGGERITKEIEVKSE